MRAVIAACYVKSARRYLEAVRLRITTLGMTIENLIESPIAGQKGNVEYLALLRPADAER